MNKIIIILRISSVVCCIKQLQRSVKELIPQSYFHYLKYWVKCIRIHTYSTIFSYIVMVQGFLKNLLRPASYKIDIYDIRKLCIGIR